MNEKLKRRAPETDVASHAAKDSERLADIQLKIEQPLFEAFGFKFNRDLQSPNDLHFYVHYGKHTAQSGPVMHMHISIAGKGHEHKGKIEVTLYGVCPPVQLFSEYLDTPEQIVPSVQVRLERA